MEEWFAWGKEIFFFNISIYLDWFNSPSLFNTAFCWMFGSRREREEKENYLIFSVWFVKRR